MTRSRSGTVRTDFGRRFRGGRAPMKVWNGVAERFIAVFTDEQLASMERTNRVLRDYIDGVRQRTIESMGVT